MWTPDRFCGFSISFDFFKTCLTTISEDDIVYISRDDISFDNIGGYMPENIVLTEATYYILLSLYDPQHGYGIMQEAERLSRGRVRLAAGTLYGALNSMVEKGWIIQLPVEDGSRKKNYQITPLGLKILKDEIERLRELVANGDEIMKGNKND